MDANLRCMQPLKMDEKLRNDIKMIQMRNYIDPKR